jgi:hypothetical protein
MTIEWTESGFVYLLDGVQAATGNWPDGFMARWNDVLANVLIESTAAAMPIERVLLEVAPEGSTGWVPPAGDASVCASADTEDDKSNASTGAGCTCQVGMGASDDTTSSLFVLLLRTLLTKF